MSTSTARAARRALCRSIAARFPPICLKTRCSAMSAARSRVPRRVAMAWCSLPNTAPCFLTKSIRCCCLHKSSYCAFYRKGNTATGPHDDPGSSVNIGVAARITAAAPKGPRFNPALNSTQRALAPNGIWPCQMCAALIDRDVRRFTALPAQTNSGSGLCHSVLVKCDRCLREQSAIRRRTSRERYKRFCKNNAFKVR